MCDRYALPSKSEAEQEFTPTQCWWKFEASFNVAPTQYAPAIRRHERETEGVMMRWGLIPSWSEDEPPAVHAHAGVDGIERSPILGSPWLNSQRCIVPLAGFYVWHLTPAGFRRPHFVRVRDQAAIGVAAVWDRWTSEEDDVTESFALLTVPPNPLVASLGAKRMPAILRRDNHDAWFKSTPVQAKAMLQTYPAEGMHAHAVSPRVNSLQHNDPELILPVAI